MLNKEQLQKLNDAVAGGAIKDTCTIELLEHIKAQEKRIAELEQDVEDLKLEMAEQMDMGLCDAE